MPIIRHGYAVARNRDSAERARNRRLVTSTATHCAICHVAFTPGDIIEADHIVSVADGGTHAISNLRATHRTCNRRRGRGAG